MPTKVKLSRLQGSMRPDELQDLVRMQLQNTKRAASAAITPVAIIDNTTGTNTGATTAVAIAEKVTPSGSNLAPKAAFDTALGTVNAAIQTLAGYMNVTYLTPLGLDTITLNATGASGASPHETIAAITKVVTGVDGSSANVAPRASANEAIVVQRNNLATLIRAVNNWIVSMGLSTLADNSGGSASATLTMATTAISGTAVDNTGDGLSDAAADAALTSLANNVARVIAKIGAIDTASGTPENIIVVP